MKLPLTTTALLFLPLASQAFQFPFLNTLKTHLPTLLFLNSKTPSTTPETTPPPVADHTRLFALHKSLIDFPSVTGTEGPVAQWLATYLQNLNFTVELQTVPGGDGTRRNLLAYLSPTRYTPTLLTSHMDVVPPHIPYRDTDTAVYGRGSCDAKGSIAAQITALLELLEAKLVMPEDVSLLFVVGEETTGDGMLKANEINPGWGTVIFGEPTEGKLAVGHKGIVEFDIVSIGRAAHSGYPSLGVDANSNLIRVLAALDGLALPGSQLLGNSTLNIGVIEGGVAANVVPAHAKATCSIRVAGDLQKVVDLIDETVRNTGGDTVKIEWYSTPHYGPVTVDHDVEGFETVVCSYGTDVPNLKGDHKRYLYGPGSILVAHGADENVRKDELTEAVGGYKRLVLESLKEGRRPVAPAQPEIVAEEGNVGEEEVQTEKVQAEELPVVDYDGDILGEMLGEL